MEKEQCSLSFRKHAITSTRLPQGSPQATQVVQGRQGRRVAFTQQSHAALQDLRTKLPRSTAARGFLIFLTFFNYCYAVEAVKNCVS